MVPVDDVHTDYYRAHAATGDGSFMDLVKRGGYEYDEFCGTYYKYEKGKLRSDGSLGFATPTGRIELIPHATYGAWGIDPYPIHRESVTSERWLNNPEFRNEFPYICINGVRSYEFFHSEHRNLKTMREFHPWPVVKIPTKAAEDAGVRDGDWLWIENKQGRCKQMVKVDHTLSENFIVAEHGWWFPEMEPSEPVLFGVFDSNISNVVHNQEVGFGGIGSPIKSVCVKIYKVQEGDKLPTQVITREGGWKTHNDWVGGYGEPYKWQQLTSLNDVEPENYGIYSEGV
jgi:anaerobic selenocysteine-containing dehydrogenase